MHSTYIFFFKLSLSIRYFINIILEEISFNFSLIVATKQMYATSFFEFGVNVT